MFHLKDKDYLPLEAYRFGWRWTNPDHTDLSPDARSRIKPLTDEKARQAWDYAHGFQGDAYWARFREVEAFAVEGRGAPDRDGVVRDWLRTRLPPSEEKVFITSTLPRRRQRSRFRT